ncbi:unnamed protein product, partial [marine sediment metagenome]
KKTLSITEKIRQKPNEDNTLDDFESAYGIEDKEIPGQAFVRVMRGCDKFCSYCVVPYVRGVEVSRPPTIIIEQIKKLAGNGVKQVTLLGPPFLLIAPATPPPRINLALAALTITSVSISVISPSTNSKTELPIFISIAITLHSFLVAKFSEKS